MGKCPGDCVRDSNRVAMQNELSAYYDPGVIVKPGGLFLSSKTHEPGTEYELEYVPQPGL